MAMPPDRAEEGGGGGGEECCRCCCFCFSLSNVAAAAAVAVAVASLFLALPGGTSSGAPSLSLRSKPWSPVPARCTYRAGDEETEEKELLAKGPKAGVSRRARATRDASGSARATEELRAGVSNEVSFKT